MLRKALMRRSEGRRSRHEELVHNILAKKSDDLTILSRSLNKNYLTIFLKKKIFFLKKVISKNHIGF